MNFAIVSHQPKSSNVTEDTESNTFSMNYHTLEDSLEQNATTIEPTAPPLKPRPLRRSLSMQHRAAKVKSDAKKSTHEKICF